MIDWIIGSIFGMIFTFMAGYALGKMDKLQEQRTEDHPGFWRQSNQ